MPELCLLHIYGYNPHIIYAQTYILLENSAILSCKLLLENRGNQKINKRNKETNENPYDMYISEFKL